MKIGLSHTGNPQKHQFYLDWLKAGNEEIEIIEFSADRNNAAGLNDCDGLILSGGIDVHPKFYGNDITDYPNAPQKFKENRDEFEMNLYRLANENKIPILGICRGMQLINVIHKGTLIQNLGDDTLNKIHKGEPDKSHPVIIEKDTMLYEITGTEKSEINSAHHQAVDRLGEGLVVNARSGEGIIEGIERKDKSAPFLLAVQWHPERMFRFGLENHPTSKAIRERFFAEIKKSMSVKK